MPFSERDSQDSRLAYPARQVRRHDRDRFSTVLFAPPDRRDDLFALYAFNLEIASVRERVREPMLGLMRLQWWREALDALYAGKAPPHEVLTPLAAAVGRHGLAREEFDRLLDTRERDFDEEPPADLAALEDYAEGTSAALTRLALQVLDARGEASMAAGRSAGIAWALTGILRAVPFHAGLGRINLPQSAMADAGVGPQELLLGRAPEAMTQVATTVATRARAHLRIARGLRRRVEPQAVPALLTATLADAYLRALRRRGYDLMDARWSRPRPRPALLAWHALRGRY